ncbi:MAG: hypothetical protein AAF633_11295 [Chloroflexota bacterium]
MTIHRLLRPEVLLRFEVGTQLQLEEANKKAQQNVRTEERFYPYKTDGY